MKKKKMLPWWILDVVFLCYFLQEAVLSYQEVRMNIRPPISLLL